MAHCALAPVRACCPASLLPWRSFPCHSVHCYESSPSPLQAHIPAPISKSSYDYTRLCFFSIDYTRLCTIISDYTRLFYFKNSNDYMRLFHYLTKDDYFTYFTTIIFLIFFGTYSCDYCNYTRLSALFYSKLLYALFCLRWIIANIFFRANYVHYAHYRAIIRISFLSYYYNDHLFPILLYALCFFQHIICIISIMAIKIIGIMRIMDIIALNLCIPLHVH
jgi:hypothetical protein